MSDQLQEALDLYDKVAADSSVAFPPDVIVDAARKVANPDLDAMTERIVHVASDEIWPDDFMKPDEVRNYAESFFNAALGIDSEDTE